MSTTANRPSKPGNSPSSDDEAFSAKSAKHPAHDLVEYAIAYSRENPEIAALWCLGIGFVLGWKLKPW